MLCQRSESVDEGSLGSYKLEFSIIEGRVLAASSAPDEFCDEKEVSSALIVYDRAKASQTFDSALQVSA